MFSTVLSLSFCCLINTAILSNEHMMFLVSPSEYLFIPKREIGKKLPFHNCESVG